ncbi:LmeA family phospholipid-binding protein [Cellulomonas sp. URHB0016]
MIGLIVLVVLGAGVVVADRVAAAEAENRAVETIDLNLDGVQGTPDVTIGGFPFLTQLLRGSLEEVSGHVDGMTLEGIDAVDVQVEAQDVSTTEPYTVGSGSIAATLPTASIEQVVADRTDLDVQVAVEGDALTASGQVLGLKLSATLTPRVEDGRLLVDVGGLRLAGLTITVDDLPSSVRSRLTDLEVPVSGLPEGLVLSKATVVADGVRITAIGTDVTLPVAADAGR